MSSNLLPSVSIATITYNRRPFFPFLIKSIQNQSYPLHKIEWVIIDDGTDSIQDLIENIDFIKVIYKKITNERLTISKKRNMSHELASGDIIIYFDDDDYYPPTRIIHAISMLQQNPQYLIAGCSIMYIYYKELEQLYKFGPYGKNHSTGASFAFKRELLNETCYDETILFGEEKSFLKNYTIPLLQLDALQTIIVFSHIHNTTDKRVLLENNEYEKKMYELQTIDKILIRDDCNNKINNNNKDIRDVYFHNLNSILENYPEGSVSNKKHILDEIEKTTNAKEQQFIKHKKIMDIYNNSIGNQETKITTNNKELVKKYTDVIEKKTIIINKLLGIINELKKNK